MRQSWFCFKYFCGTQELYNSKILECLSLRIQNDLKKNYDPNLLFLYIFVLNHGWLYGV